jgi:hypothetical protein
LQKRIKKTSYNFYFFLTYKTLAIYMGILMIKISCSVAASARGKKEEIQNRSPSKERERGK